jgi:hypothetical protein
MKAKAFPTAAILLLLATLLAGCGGGRSAEGEPAWVIGSTCGGAAASLCHEEADGLHLSGLVANGRGEGAGLLVRSLTTPLFIEGAEITGYQTGISIRKTCEACSVSIVDSTIAASVHVVYIDEALGPVTVSKSVLLAEGDGGQIAANATTVLISDPHAIFILGLAGPLRLEDSQIMSTVGGHGRGVWFFATHGSTMDVSNVSFAGFGVTLEGSWERLLLENTTIECVYTALWAPYIGELAAQRLRVQDCHRGAGRCPGPDCTSAFNVFEGREVTFAHADFIGHGAGLTLAGEFQRVVLSDFNFTDGVTGVRVHFAQDMLLRDGTVAGERQLGVQVGVDRLTVERVQFLGNGLEPQDDQSSQAGLEVRAHDNSGAVYPGPRVIRNSTFEGNRVWGLQGEFDAPLDARWNWWGNAAGPSPATPAMLGNPQVPGFGDMADGATITAPHLTSPP